MKSKSNMEYKLQQLYLSNTIPVLEDIQIAFGAQFQSNIKKFMSRLLLRLRNSHVNLRKPEEKNLTPLFYVNVF
jgi:hypothetical protein